MRPPVSDKSLALINETVSTEETPYLDLPLDISDILTVCKEYHRLGWNMQHQIEAIIEYGVEQAIDERMVDVAALPHIKHFLKGIASNFYFGDAQLQASEVVKLIKHFERTRPNIRPGN
jgi:hypothetical protein